MAINLKIYSNSNAASKTIVVDFVSNLLAGKSTGDSNETQHYFIMSANATDTNGVKLPTKTIISMDDFVLNGKKRRITDSNVAYPDIKTMIIDYTYDYIYGHSADLYNSGVKKQAPLKFK